MLITMPQLLAGNGVPEPRIASITAIGLIPSFCSFLLSPILDWRFRRRSYAIIFAGLAALMSFASLMFIHQLRLLTLLLFIGATAITLYGAAIGGWLGSLTSPENKSRLGAWLAVGNVGGGGLTAVIGIFLLRDLPFDLGAALLSLIILLPLPLFALTHAPSADRRLASESFRAFFRDVLAVLQRRSVLWTLLLFAMPAASFALTNTLSGLGHDFAASEHFVGIVAGAGVMLPGIAASLLVPSIMRRVPPIWLYLLIGTFGALFTLMLAGLRGTPAVFAHAVLGENAFQSAAFAVENTIILNTIGEGNPLAATQYALLYSAPTFPIAYMQAVDGAAYGIGGLSGSYLADALLSLAACAVLALLFGFVRQTEPEVEAARVSANAAM
jgi:PAT family beta-lactamase induction signal transducer AmpG